MAGGAAKAHFNATGRKVRMMRQSVRERWFDIWEGLPWMMQPGERGPCDTMFAKDKQGLRPYIAGKTDDQWTWRAYGPTRSAFVFTAAEKTAGEAARGSVVVEPNLKPAASPNKDWGWDRWQQLVRLRPDIDWVQLGAPGAKGLKGVRRIETPTFRIAAAMLAAARAAVLTEGALHHAAAATRTPAVVIFGGYIAPAVTGYASQYNLFTDAGGHHLGCGMRIPCNHCAAAMAAITPERVLNVLEVLLASESANQAGGRRLAAGA